MIRLEKGPKPAILVRNEASWTEELLRALESGEPNSDAIKSSRYAHKEIKLALLEETTEKCAYCESKPLHVSFGDVEHICPKAVNPSRSYEWENLTLACSVCNNKKKDKEGMVDPYAEDPIQAFEFFGPMIAERAAHPSAKRTRIELDLNRKELMSQRAEFLAKIRSELLENRSNSDVNERIITEEAIISHYKNRSGQFSACASHFLDDFIARNPL